MRPLHEYSYFQKALVVILFSTIIRLFLSYFLGLGNDESYYWTYADRLQWNYFDHPPLVGVWIKFFTVNLLLQDHLFFIRLGSILGGALCSFFMYRAIAAISTEKAGFIGVFLYNVSFYALLSAGTIITPDAPQMVFWTMSMYMITKIFKDVNRWKYWLLFGITAGLCIMSKVHGVFLWAGLGLYILLYPRKLFLKPQLYVSALFTLMVISPIIIWNIQNDFITYRFHSERVVIQEAFTLNWFNVLKELIGQIIINNPFNIGLIIFFFFSVKRTLNSKEPLTVYNLTGISLLTIIFLIALFRQTLPHWSGPAYVSLLPGAAIGLSEVTYNKVKRTLLWTFAYTAVFILLLIAAVNFYPGTFGERSEQHLGKGDISLDAYGWKEAGEQFGVIYNSIYGKRTAAEKPPMVCNNWWGAHEEYYFARPLGIKMIGLGPVIELHHYAWRNKYNLPQVNMDTAYSVVHSDEYFDVKKTFADYYTTVDSVTTINILRGNKPAHDFYVYRLSGWRK